MIQVLLSPTYLLEIGKSYSMEIVTKLVATLV